MAATGSSGDDIAQKSLTQVFGDAIQESVTPETLGLMSEALDVMPTRQRMTTWPERDDMTDLQIPKVASYALAHRIQQDEAYHRQAANLFGSGSLAGIRDLGVPNNLRALQEKRREKDERYYALLGLLIEKRMRELADLTHDLADMADRLEKFNKNLLTEQDQAFAQIDTLEEAMNQYERTGSMDDARVRQSLQDRQVKIPPNANDDLLYQMAAQEVPIIRQETQRRQEAMETCERESQTLRDQAMAVRETVEEVQGRSSQGIYAEDDAERLEATKKRACGCLETARQHFEQMEQSRKPPCETNGQTVKHTNAQTATRVTDIATGFDL